MLNLFYADDTPVSSKQGAWAIKFPMPTRVGKTQTMTLHLKNSSLHDKYQIAKISVGDPELSVEYPHDFLVTLNPGDKLKIDLTFNPKTSRKTPLNSAEFNVEAWHVMVTET